MGMRSELFQNVEIGFLFQSLSIKGLEILKMKGSSVIRLGISGRLISCSSAIMLLASEESSMYT